MASDSHDPGIVFWGRGRGEFRLTVSLFDKVFLVRELVNIPMFLDIYPTFK